MAVEPVINDPADNPALDKNDIAAVPAAANTLTPTALVAAPKNADVAILPTKGASRKVKLLVADATEVVPDVALLTNHDTLFVAFWVIAVMAVSCPELDDATTATLVGAALQTVTLVDVLPVWTDPANIASDRNCIGLIP